MCWGLKGMKENQNLIILERRVLEQKRKFGPKNQDSFSQQVFPICCQRRQRENRRVNEKEAKAHNFSTKQEHG